ncbi:ABC transporter substrate-binding protein [Beijerinckia indica]|uniref:Extracellular solute-binding protein family 5 n=1 Tax=Beijerinckia indica subsp. indica (strain ATCC 9039 / DSM 1715 / NCIMB 8712) TaxID=395963 RepID=B2IIT7_BEII9|nr:extracellular solute-binding protein family 5 [Beijerinckia indica subsp. indica ATCC 9039]
MHTSFFRPTRRELLAYSGALAGCASIASPRRLMAAPKRGGSLSLLVSVEPQALTGIATTANPVLAAKVNEGLLTYDFDLSPRPQLAVAWTVSEDGLAYTFRLRPGVKWHDGKPFTSEDVAFSLTTLKEVHPRARGTFLNLVEVRTPDPLVVQLRLAKPAPYLLTAFAAEETPIFPKHIYEHGRVETNPANNSPIGTGPFRFKEWVRGSHVIYERNPDYWDEGKPYIDRLIVRIIPDSAARVTALETGEVHITASTSVPMSDADRLKTSPELAFESNGYQYMNSISRIEFNLDRPAFKDVRVRRAFAHVIDRTVIRDVANYGYGTPIPGPISVTLSKFFYPELPVYDTDTKKAEGLLDAAGFPRGEGGIRLRVTHDYLPGGDYYRRSADYLKQALAKVGIAVQIRSQDFAAYTKRVYTDRDFDFTINGMSNLFDPTVGVQRLYWSKNFKPGVPFSNGSHYVNPVVDRLLEEAAVEIDPRKRYDQFVAFQKLIAEDVPDISILGGSEFTIYNRKISGHTIGAEGVFGNFADIHFVG